jgi:hypothetical protein
VLPLVRALSTVLGIALVSGLGLATAPDAAAASDAARKSFVSSLVTPAQSAQRQYGVPASVSIAQAAVNTDWGASKLADQADNYFNTRCSAVLTAAEFAKLAEAQVGKKYILGAEAALTNSSPRAFDCSELVQWLYGRSGNPITDLAAAQYNATTSVSTSSPKPGDLVFLRNNPARSNGIGHVAVVTKKLSNGDWEIIEARGRAYGVVKTTLSYWKQRAYFAGMRRYTKLTFAGTDGVIKVASISSYQSGCVAITSGGKTVKYRKYTSPAKSLLDHAAFVATEPDYASARQAMNSVSRYVDAIAKLEGGADPSGYAKKLRQVIDAYDLTQYDVAPLSIVLLSKASGAKVRALQYLLTAAGKTVKVTGTFDSATKTAVKAFQKAKGLEVDGEAGPNTLTALMATVRKGDVGNRPAALNALLVQAGYPTDSGSTFGSKTLTSLKAFQTAAGLDATGSANAKTWSRLFMLLETTPVPTLSGSTIVGRTLAVTAGTWGPGKVDVAYQWYRGNTAIASATGATYTLQPEDVRQPIRVVATGSKATYTSVSRTSASTAAVTPATLTSTPVPTITGTATAGKTLTAVAGTWAPGPVAVTYQWYRGKTAIAGATGPTHVLTAADYKQTLSVRTTGTRPGYYSVTQSSAATAAVAKGKLGTVGTPTIAGTARVGDTLTVNPGTWGPGEIPLTYQWYRADKAIKGATGITYVLTPDDAGKTISVKATSATPAFASQSGTSKPTGKVAKLTWPSTPELTISGTPEAGQTLTALPGTWTPAAAFSYQWYRDSTAIAGATKVSYTLTAADYQHSITVRAVAARAGYESVTKASKATAPVKQGKLTAAGTPTISGTKTVGRTLTAKPGTWGPGKVPLAYQWYRGSAKISGATKSTYKLTSKDAGKTIKVRVTSRTDAFAQVSMESKATAKIAKA